MTWTRERLKELEGAINTVQSNPYDPYDSMVLEAARAFLSLKKTGGWLPIAEAPRDGTRVMLWTDKWTASQSGQWYGTFWGHDYVLGAWKCQPTMWQPLPAAPEDGE